MGFALLRKFCCPRSAQYPYMLSRHNNAPQLPIPPLDLSAPQLTKCDAADATDLACPMVLNYSLGASPNVSAVREGQRMCPAYS